MQNMERIWIHFLWTEFELQHSFFSHFLILYFNPQISSLIVITSKLIAKQVANSFWKLLIKLHYLQNSPKRFNRVAQNIPSLQYLSLQTRTCWGHSCRDLKERHVPRMEAFSESVRLIPMEDNTKIKSMVESNKKSQF